jgi:hypothetical protein
VARSGPLPTSYAERRAGVAPRIRQRRCPANRIAAPRSQRQPAVRRGRASASVVSLPAGRRNRQTEPDSDTRPPYQRRISAG